VYLHSYHHNKLSWACSEYFSTSLPAPDIRLGWVSNYKFKKNKSLLASTCFPVRLFACKNLETAKPIFINFDIVQSSWILSIYYNCFLKYNENKRSTKRKDVHCGSDSGAISQFARSQRVSDVIIDRQARVILSRKCHWPRQLWRHRQRPMRRTRYTCHPLRTFSN
jgi:hypothetical protein